MQFTPWWRRAALTSHIMSSVGWFGAVLVFLVLALVGVRSTNDQLVRAIYIALEVVGWYVIVPFSVATLLTGLIQSAGTKWGFVQHYWVVTKLLITIAASLLLLLHMQVMSTVAQAAAAGTWSADHLRIPRMQLVGDAAAAVAVLAIAIVLSVFKPEGRTAFASATGAAKAEAATPMVYAFWLGVVVLLAAIVARHLGGGLPHH